MPSLIHSQNISLRIDAKTSLPGQLNMPDLAVAVVLFAHGSGSSWLSPRNQYVARTLNEAGFGTLLFDLLTPLESEDRRKVFDISLLAERLVQVTHWVKSHCPSQSLPIGYFGASTGAAAALCAAAELGEQISAVVSRGGRPDLAMSQLKQIKAPVLLIVGEYDDPVIEMNQKALRYIQNGELTIVPNATHLFEESGALEAVSRLATHWFSRHLKQVSKESRTPTKKKAA